MEPILFGKYQLMQRIAEGGMAVVWRAKLYGPGGFEKNLCLKQIRNEYSARREFIDLFVAEAKLTVALTHANIVPVFELGMVDGTYFLALELVDGPPLAQIIKKGPVAPPVGAYIVEQILRGLDYAHRRNVVHRDLSASNVLVSREGEVKIVDFGIAAPVDARGVQGGSRGYVAPEQESGERADARSDLYAVGVLLWELCAGRFYDDKPIDAPEALLQIIGRATEKDPNARFSDAHAMLVEVSHYLRDVEGPTQSDLSRFVRQRCPEGWASGAWAVINEGPRTMPMEGRAKKQVTFATRIAPPTNRRLRILAAVAVTTAVAAAGVGWYTLSPRKAPLDSPTPVRARATHVITTQPPSGRLAVKTQPPGAEVYLAGRLAGVTPLEINVVLAGPVAVQLKKHGYTPVEKVLGVEAFLGGPVRSATLSERLVALGRGALTLGATPWAHVTIDGEKQPDTPLVKLPLAVGAHVVHVACPPTNREYRFTVQIEPDKEVKRVVDLRGEPKLIQ